MPAGRKWGRKMRFSYNAVWEDTTKLLRQHAPLLAAIAGVRTLGAQHREYADIVAVSDQVLRHDLVLGCVQKDP